jgi:hypothetical protein
MIYNAIGSIFMYRVRYKSHNALQAWAVLGSYGNEQSALSNAARVSGQYLMVQVLDPNGNVIWVG